MRSGGPTVLALATLTLLAACGPQAPLAARPPATVHTEVVELADYAPGVVLTGEIRAQVETELSFRTSGRITELHADVGSHVEAGTVLARIAPDEQQADILAEQAAVEAAAAEVRQTAAKFDRQKTLLAKGFTTRPDHDGAEEAFRTAEASLDSARAQLATAEDALSFTELRAAAAGVITARTAEVGQVVQAAESSFTLAHDGSRDAVFDVPESVFAREPEDVSIAIELVEDPNVTATGTVREVSPTVDRSSGTVQVKVAVDRPPPRMTLGASVTGRGQLEPRKVIILPWTSVASLDGKPAVWIVDRPTNSVSLRSVEVVAFETGTIVVGSGLDPGELVVTVGTQLLRPRQIVAPGNNGDVGDTDLVQLENRQAEAGNASAPILDEPQVRPAFQGSEPASLRGSQPGAPGTDLGVSVNAEVSAGSAEQAASSLTPDARLPRPRPGLPTGAS